MSDTAADPAPAQRKRRAHRPNKKQSALRANRVMIRLREGKTHRAIADDEGVSLRRVRSIIKSMLKDREENPAAVHAQAQIDRLAPAFALADGKIADGKLAGVRVLLALQKRLDAYQALTGPTNGADEAAKERAKKKSPILTSTL